MCAHDVVCNLVWNTPHCTIMLDNFTIVLVGERMEASVFSRAEDWPMTEWMSIRIKAWENRHFRAFMKWRRMPGELNQGYNERTDDRVQKLLLQSKKPHLFHRIFRLRSWCARNPRVRTIRCHSLLLPIAPRRIYRLQK